MTTHTEMLAILARCPYFPEAGFLPAVQAIAATVYFQVSLSCTMSFVKLSVQIDREPM